MKKSPLFFLISILVIAAVIPLVHCPPVLNLTVTTHKPAYYIGENVYIYGNLTLDGNLVENGLIGLEVDTPNNIALVRTLPTNTTPVGEWLVEVLDVIPCDEYGNPKDTFNTKTLAHFSVSVRNEDIEILQVLTTVTVYDYSRAPIGVSSIKLPISGNSTVGFILSIAISSKAANGVATVYANAYSEFPSKGGKAYCPEKSRTFQITGGVTQPPDPIHPELINGNYNTTFKLSKDKPLGIYNVYATAIYFVTAVNVTEFQINVQGDIDGDGVVGGLDAGLLGLHWPPQPYDPSCDLDGDGVIGGLDAGILGMNWGYGT